MASLLTDEFVREQRAAGRPRGPARAARPLAPHEDRGLQGPRAGGRDAGPSGHRPHRRRGARGGLDARGRLDLGRGVGARDARARRRRGEGGPLQRAGRRRGAGQEARSRRSTCSRWSAPGADPARDDRRRGLAQRPARGGGRRACAAWSPSAATRATRTSPRPCSWSRASATRASRRGSSPTAARPSPGRYITLDDLQACLQVPAPQEVT